MPSDHPVAAAYLFSRPFQLQYISPGNRSWHSLSWRLWGCVGRYRVRGTSGFVSRSAHPSQGIWTSINSRSTRVRSSFLRASSPVGATSTRCPLRSIPGQFQCLGALSDDAFEVRDVVFMLTARPRPDQPACGRAAQERRQNPHACLEAGFSRIRAQRPAKRHRGRPAGKQSENAPASCVLAPHRHPVYRLPYRISLERDES